MSAIIDDHDPLATVCHCEWCQGSSKVERADAVATMSATPRTDAHLLGGSYSFEEFARGLERELSLAQAAHAADMAEMNDRLMDRQQTLIEKGIECEEMRKLLELSCGLMQTSDQLLDVAIEQARILTRKEVLP
jgi:hypothetical protein